MLSLLIADFIQCLLLLDVKEPELLKSDIYSVLLQLFVQRKLLAKRGDFLADLGDDGLVFSVLDNP